MALFGKKAKDSGSDTALAEATGEATGQDEGAVAVAVEEAPAPGKKVKAARAPKAPKNSTVKNGVAVGLNIGNQFIKAVEVTSKGGELSVTAMGAVPTPPESYTNGNVLSVSALSGAIRELWKGAGIKSKVAITSVAGTGALVVRVIEVPKVSDSELADNMKLDADRYIPFPPSEVVMDFKALRELPSDPDAPNMEVLLAAAQREIIDLHVQVVQKARLDPRAIDVEPIAAARAMQLERRGDGNSGYIDYNEVTALVNLGATGTEISILRGDILVFTRVVPGGGNVMTQAIAEGLGVPFSDAERVKIESADALAPAGYNQGGQGDFGDGGDFNFGDDFSGGGDLNAAFDDISANPTAAASDDPFDLDFFNQNPQNEPGAGHAQKEGEPGENPPSPFDFGGFDFDAPAEQEKTPEAAPIPAPNAAESSAPVSFNFGFDELSNEDLPTSVAPIVVPEPVLTPPVSLEKATAKLEDEAPTPVAAPIEMPVSGDAPVPAVASQFAMPMGSAFDFDNFDLPTAEPENLTTTSLPYEPAPAATPAPIPFDFGALPGEPGAGATLPIGFDLENEDLASKNAAAVPMPIIEAPAPMDFEPVVAAPIPTEPISFEPVATVSIAPAPIADPFDFSMETPAPTFAAVPVEVLPELTETAPPMPAIPAATDEFDLDAIFGTTTTDNAAVEAEPSAETAVPDADFDGFGVVAPVAVVAANAAPAPGDFDLSGIDTGGDDFGAGFGDSGDFTEFGAGLGAGGAGADAIALYGLISPSLEELAGEVRRSLEFHLGRYPDATISRLVLLGGGARLRNLDVFLTQMIGVPTAVGNPFAHIKVQTPKLPPAYASDNGPLCTVALGLALRDFVD